MTEINSIGTDHRALLATIRGRLVRAVANEDTPYAKALFEIVKQRKRVWTKDEWDAVEHEVDTSKQTIEEFLNAEHLRPKS